MARRLRPVPGCGGKMQGCEVLETDASGDEWRRVCNLRPIGRCYDCGVPACWKHFETCPTCQRKFCSSCMTFHLSDHPKAMQVAPPRSLRKSA